VQDHERSWSLLGLNREREALLLKRIAREVIEALMNLREQEKAKCCYVLWICWFEHNRVREGEPRRDASCLSHSIQIRLEEWKKTAVQGRHSARSPTCKWEKPEVGSVKVNCDAAYNGSTGNGGWGCIVRYDEGDVVSARRGRVESLMCLHGELIAVI